MVRPLNGIIGVLQVPKARAGGEHERCDFLPLPSCKGVRGTSPEKMFNFKMSVDVILMHLASDCEIRLIVQEFNVAVFKRVSCKE